MKTADMAQSWTPYARRRTHMQAPPVRTVSELAHNHFTRSAVNSELLLLRNAARETTVERQNRGVLAWYTSEKARLQLSWRERPGHV